MGSPTFLYRWIDGGIEARVFDSDALPKEGIWTDDPHTCRAAAEGDAKPARRKPARPRNTASKTSTKAQ